MFIPGLLDVPYTCGEVISDSFTYLQMRENRVYGRHEDMGGIHSIVDGKLVCGGEVRAEPRGMRAF